MDDIAIKASQSSYEDDFYAWTQEQAELLQSGRLDEADIASILEEIVSLGRTQVAELRSRLKVLVHHLLKELFQPEKASRSRATTIVVQRDDIAVHLMENPSLRPQATALFLQAYGSARKAAAAETGIALETFPQAPPFTYTQAMDETFWPVRSLDDRS